jgi:hypothetical protein
VGENCRRLGVQIVATLACDGRQAGGCLRGAQYDRVLVDAPCSNTGVLRRRPDLPLLGRILGQSTLRVTERYTHLLPGHLSEGRNVVQVVPSRQTLDSTLAVDKMAHRKAYKTRSKQTKRP